MAVDERLRRELDRAGRPADPSGVYEHLIRRRERQRLLGRVERIGLALLVIAGCIAGVLALSRVFGSTGNGVAVPTNASGRLTFVVSRSDGGAAIVSANADGSDRTTVAEVEGSIVSLDWSPDGTRLAFVVLESDDPGRGLFVLDILTGVVHPVDGIEVYSGITWSPDSTQIAYADRWHGTDAIFTADADGSNRERLTGAGTYAAAPDWAPDGTRIVFVGEEAGLEVDRWDLFVIDLASREVMRLTDDPAADLDPDWSPDGTRIVFRSRRDIVDPSLIDQPDEVYVMNADGSGRTRLTVDEATDQSPSWSHDGIAIAFTSFVSGEDSNTQLVVMSPDGSDRAVVAQHLASISTAWQPVGAETSPSPSISPVPTEAPTPSPSESPRPSEEIGLGFPVCNVSSIRATFVTTGEDAVAYVATRRGDTGGCPAPENAFNVLALDVDDDGLSDASYGPIECALECRTFSAPDLDADGTAELLIVQSGGSIVALDLYDVVIRDGVPVIEPVTIAAPGDPAGGFEPGANVHLLLGGDEFFLYALACGDPEMRHGPGIVVTAAESLPHDSPDARWHAHRTVFALVDGSLRVMDVGDFTEPAGFDPPSFQSGETLCGSNLGP